MINSYPKITIITPSFNQVQYLEQTILSIINQNYPNLEYIIIDGGSTDGSVDIIKKYESRLHFWVSENDRGQSHAINKGLEHSSGEIFNWINSDDYLEPGALFEVARCFVENKEKYAVGGYCRLFDDYKQTAIISRIGRDDSTEGNIINYWMNQPSTFYKTEVIKGFGGVNESLNYCMDLEIWFRFLAQFGISSIHYTNHLLSHFRHHDASKTESLKNGFLFENDILLHEICRELKINSVLINALSIPDNYYVSQHSWSTISIETNRFELILSQKYHHVFWEAKKHDALITALRILLFNGKLSFNRYYISLFWKALFKR